MTQAGLGGAPRSPLNVKIGPHRRFAWVDGELATFKTIKDALGGTVNDVVLTVVTGALRSHFVAHGYDTDVELKAMVPVSVRADSERGALGNKVAAMYAPLPIGLEDPIARFRAVHDAMRGLKESGQAVGAEALTTLADFAPPTILSQAARIQAVQRFFNLTVTNVPGPQFPLFLLGRQLARLYPLVPIVENAALGIAIMSYNGRIDFGLVSDYDALPDVDKIATALEGAIGELATLAGVPSKPRGRRTRAKQTA
jgi:WS/DGAT/MGAT family acyltransferase